MVRLPRTTNSPSLWTARSTFRFIKLADDQVPGHEGGAVQFGGEPNGPRMGKVVARKGHQVLLPHGAAYQLSAASPAVALIQTVDGPVTVKRWAEICVTN